MLRVQPRRLIVEPMSPACGSDSAHRLAPCDLPRDDTQFEENRRIIDAASTARRGFLDYAGAIRLHAGELITIYGPLVSSGRFRRRSSPSLSPAVAQNRTLSDADSILTPVGRSIRAELHQRRGDVTTAEDFRGMAE